MTPTILIVEDQDDIAQLARLILQSEGYATAIADSGEEGLRQLDEAPADLVLLDVMLPGIDGWEVCRRIRTAPALARVPILLFTVRNARDDDHRPEFALADGLVTKPFARSELLEAVAATLAAKAAPGSHAA